MRRSAALALTVIVMISSGARSAPGAEAAAPAAPSDAVARLHELFDREWAWRLKQSPELATSVGVHDDDDKLSDLAPETLARQAKETEAFRAELAKISRDALPFAEQANYDIFSTQLRERFESSALGTLLFPILVLLVIPYVLTGLIGAGPSGFCPVSSSNSTTPSE